MRTTADSSGSTRTLPSSIDGSVSIDRPSVLEGPDHQLRRTLAGRARVRAIALLVGVVSVLAAAVVAVSVGAAGLSVSDAALAVADRLPGTSALVDANTASIVWELRLPRIALAVVGGAALALSGTTMQALLRNPLVSPFTLGISSAAAFGASVAIVFGASLAGGGRYVVVANALACALACATLAFSLSWAGKLRAETLILVGIALTYLFGALTATLQLIANDQQLAAIVQWTFGSLNGASWEQAVVVGLVVAVAFPVFLRSSQRYDAIAFLGDDSARALGVDVLRTRVVTMVLAVVLAAVVVSFCGVIGFVGLVAPHIARLLVGGSHRTLLPFAAICGAALLLVADTVGRTIVAPAIIPVGIVVSFLGVPLFLQLVVSRARAAR
ncbi:MAG: iron ABC transporter permease [Acidimicrobiia bacterium]|nr:iron ABC transporter permease [Acidimicrobiia bacterium]